MAIYSPGTVAGSISGSVGGLTFVNARGSKVLRPRASRPDPRGTGLENSKSQMNRLQNAWADLTDLERDAWRAAAETSPTTNRLGQSRPLTGHQLFLKYNLEMHDDTPPTFDTPSVEGRSEGPRSIDVTLSAAGVLRWEAQPPEGFGAAIFFMYARLLYTPTPPKSAPQVVFMKRLTAPSLFEDIRPEIEATFGIPVENQTMICGFAATAGGIYRSFVSTIIEQVGA